MTAPLGGLLAGKRAIVTGASRGIGRAIVDRFAAEGAKVMAAARHRPDDLPAGIMWRDCDVTKRADVEAVIAAARDAFGGIDVLVNNAGVLIEGTLVDTSDEDWERQFAVNVRSVFYACRAAIPIMAAGGGGSIVNLGSVSGQLADFGMAGYNATKAAVHLLTRSVAVDHGSQGIRCNAVCPGWIKTDMLQQSFALAADPAAAEAAAAAQHPLRRLGRPEDIAALAAWLASDQSAFVSGHLYTVDGGLIARSPIGPD
ncbi:MAG: SDR family oxidoreductase [Rhodospirillaceae bacterium]|nr:SDR family oxidoreductase [Rhodospirillaceae bacterium]